MQYSIAAMALAGVAAALPDNYNYGGYSSAPVEYTTSTPAAYYPTTTEKPTEYQPTEYKPTEYKPTEYSTSTAPAYYSSETAPAYYSSSESAPAYYSSSESAPAYYSSSETAPAYYSSSTETAPAYYPTPYTTTVSQYTTYCPEPTTIETYGKTYTVTAATTLTVCPGNCVYTSTYAAPPVYTTSTVSAYTTVCPTPTTIYTHGQTYPVTKPSQTVTICEGGCYVTSPVTPVGPAYTGAPAPAPYGTGAYKPMGNGTYPTKPATYTGGAAVVSAAPVALLALGALLF